MDIRQIKIGWLLLGWVPAVLYTLTLGSSLFSPVEQASLLVRILGVVVAATFPGVLLAPLATRSQEQGWVLLTYSVIFSVFSHILLVVLCRLAAVPVVPGWTLLGGGLMGVVGVACGWRHPLEVVKPRRGTLMGMGLIVVGVLLYGWNQLPVVTRELHQYFYHADPMAGNYSGVDLGAASITWEGLPTGQVGDSQGEVALRSEGVDAAEIRIFALLEGPIGAELTLTCGEERRRAQVQRDVVEVEEEGAVPRYEDRGTAALVWRTRVEPGQVQSCAWTLAGTQHLAKITDFTGKPDEALWDDEQRQGYVLTHYYQLLNIVENIRWAKETLVDRWLTINQPPLWSWVYSGVVLYAGPGMFPLHLLFFGLVLGVAAAGFRLSCVEDPRLPWFFALIPLLFALSHARIMLASGSGNFPDNLYALLVILSLLCLVEGQRLLFVLVALLCTFVRYPGSTVILLMCGWLALLDRPRRREALAAGSQFVAVLLVPCLLLGLGALVTGNLLQWLDILWFETFPEHFHDNYDMAALLVRPPEFYGLLLQYSAWTPLLLVRVRGRIPMVALALALNYSLFLCFIDHFPSHYFLPLLALLGVALTGTLAHIQRGYREVGLALVGGLMGWWLLFGQL